MNKIRMPQSLVRDAARFVNLLWIPVYPIFNECFIEPILKIFSMDTKAYTQSSSSKLSPSRRARPAESESYSPRPSTWQVLW